MPVTTFTNKTFFVRELNIPNTDTDEVLEHLTLLIEKHEPECLKLILGYPLYKEFMSSVVGVNVGTVLGNTIRFDEPIKVDTTVGLVSGTSTFTFDGTSGKPDYRGYEIVISEYGGRGIMVKGVDYSYDYTTGEFNLLTSGDIFASNQIYNVHFQPHQVVVGQVGSITQRFTNLLYGCDYTDFNGRLKNWQGLIHGNNNISLIAAYIYYYYKRDTTSHTTGVATVIQNAEQGKSVSPEAKMRAAWNFFSTETKDLCSFLWNMNNKSGVPAVYPETDNTEIRRVLEQTRKITALW